MHFSDGFEVDSETEFIFARLILSLTRGSVSLLSLGYGCKYESNILWSNTPITNSSEADEMQCIELKLCCSNYEIFYDLLC